MGRVSVLGFTLSVLSLSLILEASSSGSFPEAWAVSSYIGGEPLVYVDPPACYSSLGATFSVNISIASVKDLYAYDLMLYYDTNVLDAVEIKLPSGHFLEPVNPARLWIVKLETDDDYNSTHGYARVAIGLMNPELGRDGSGVLATVTFLVAKPGNCALDLCEKDLQNLLVSSMSEEIDFGVQDGYFECNIAEHEIAVFLEAPSHIVPGESANISASVLNGGQSDEASVVLQLFIDGTMVDSATISSLPAGSRRTQSYSWAPQNEAKYNVTAFGLPLADEKDTLNNVNSKTVAVSYVIRVPADFASIQEAIQAANSGEMIRVASGIYYEHLIIDKSVTLIGENVNNTIVDGSGSWKIVLVGEQSMYGCSGGASRISGFTIQHGLVGIHIDSCDNTIEGCVMRSCDYGVFLSESVSDNVVCRSTIAENEYGILCDGLAHNNRFYHNNIVNNTYQVVDQGSNIWSDGDEGNYWNDYNGTDTDNDNIGEMPYQVNATQGIHDAAPLISEYVYVMGDLNDDGGVSAFDLDVAAVSFESCVKRPRWNSAADINSDGRVDIIDMALIAKALKEQVDTGNAFSPFEKFGLLAAWVGVVSLAILVAVSILYKRRTNAGRRANQRVNS